MRSSRHAASGGSECGYSCPVAGARGPGGHSAGGQCVCNNRPAAARSPAQQTSETQRPHSAGSGRLRQPQLGARTPAADPRCHGRQQAGADLSPANGGASRHSRQPAATLAEPAADAGRREAGLGSPGSDPVPARRAGRLPHHAQRPGLPGPGGAVRGTGGLPDDRGAGAVGRRRVSLGGRHPAKPRSSRAAVRTLAALARPAVRRDRRAGTGGPQLPPSKRRNCPHRRHHRRHRHVALLAQRGQAPLRPGDRRPAGSGQAPRSAARTCLPAGATSAGDANRHRRRRAAARRTGIPGPATRPRPQRVFPRSRQRRPDDPAAEPPVCAHQRKRRAFDCHARSDGCRRPAGRAAGR